MIVDYLLLKLKNLSKKETFIEIQQLVGAYSLKKQVCLMVCTGQSMQENMEWKERMTERSTLLKRSFS